jgi:hypothetical protein
MEANQNVWIAYHKDQVAKQEKFNSDCQRWASEMNVREEKARADQERVKKDLQKLKHLQEQLRQDQVNASAVSQREREDMWKSLREELQSIREELKVQFQSAQQSRKGIDVTSVIDSILKQHAQRGRVPLPNDDETDSLYDLPPPPRSERSGRGSIPRGRTTESRDSSPPGGVVLRQGPHLEEAAPAPQAPTQSLTGLRTSGTRYQNSSIPSGRRIERIASPSNQKRSS